MTAEDLAKQARMSAMTVGMPTDKSGLTVKSAGTPPERTTPASASATAPVATTPTRGYSQADMDRFASSPDTVASMQRINATLAATDKLAADMKPTTDGTMNQFQLDAVGLKEQPKVAPKGVDPLGYYQLSNMGMTNAEREKYNADLDRSTILNNEPRMSLIDSPEWLNENFGVKLPAQPAAPTPVATQQNYALNVPDDVMKQMESYNFQFKHGGTTSKAFAVNGAGDGREDKIDAKLSDGEYVIDAETVALLGNGSSKAGAQQLDKFRVNIRKHKGQKLASGKFSANAKSPEAYMAGGRS
jgi:hypothetical protein